MSKLPGGGRSTEYILRTFSVGLPRHIVPRNDNDYGDSSEGYFACAQYDVKKISRRRKCGRFFTRSDFAAGQTTRICRFPQAGVPRQDFRKSGNADDFFAKAKKSVRSVARSNEKKPPEVYLREALSLERATRIGLATEAWEAPILPLNYARIYRVAYLTQPYFYILLYLP